MEFLRISNMLSQIFSTSDTDYADYTENQNSVPLFPDEIQSYQNTNIISETIPEEQEEPDNNTNESEQESNNEYKNETEDQESESEQETEDQESESEQETEDQESDYIYAIVRNNTVIGYTETYEEFQAWFRDFKKKLSYTNLNSLQSFHWHYSCVDTLPDNCAFHAQLIFRNNIWIVNWDSVIDTIRVVTVDKL